MDCVDLNAEAEILTIEMLLDIKENHSNLVPGNDLHRDSHPRLSSQLKCALYEINKMLILIDERLKRLENDL
jgi:hypothetical protein